MGRRGGTETLAAVLLAFLEQRTWKQAALAAHVGVGRKQLVRVLNDLQARLQLEREEDRPHVYWSVSKGWFPGAVAFSGSDVRDLVHLLRLAPRSPKRDRLFSRIGALATGVSCSLPDAVITSALSPSEEAYLTVLQESAGQKLAVHARYHTLQSGLIMWRFLSVHRILIEQRRFVATCHRDNRLKWFRIDGVLSVQLSTEQAFRNVDGAAIQQLLDESVDGYHPGTPAVRCMFRVSLPDARWVQAHLPLPCTVEEERGGLVFTAVTAGLLPLARFLVGLGRAARIDTPELRQLVIELARGALGEPGSKRDTPESNPEHASGAPIEPAE